MNSPIIETIFSSIRLDQQSEKPIYLQLSEKILDLIRQGRLMSGEKLPSSRVIAGWLCINRITVTKAFDELQAQGWLESHVGRGTFVSALIQEMQPNTLWHPRKISAQKMAGFGIQSQAHFELRLSSITTPLHLDDGFPDPMLAPLKELHRVYRAQLNKRDLYDKYGRYGNPAGSDYYRQSISDYLNLTRGLNTTAENVISVKGTIMGINLVCNGLISPGDVIVSGMPGWNRAERNFIHARAKHITISVDEHGLVVEELKTVCEKHKVRMVYLTPHHHYPTTVSLRIDRRLELLKLANEHGFIIFEDDYDFDFHYQHRPLLPLASADEHGMVIYSGSFSKSFSPAFRMGYLVAAENVIEHLSNVRVLLDRQGDQIIDNAMAELLNDGTIQRYLRKALPIYERKRDLFCNLLEANLADVVNFNIPEGGMTVWTEFDKAINLERLAEKASQKGLYIADGTSHCYPGYDVNGIRLGFASSSEEDLIKSVEILKDIL